MGDQRRYFHRASLQSRHHASCWPFDSVLLCYVLINSPHGTLLWCTPFDFSAWMLFFLSLFQEKYLALQFTRLTSECII